MQQTKVIATIGGFFLQSKRKYFDSSKTLKTFFPPKSRVLNARLRKQDRVDC